MSGSPRLWLGAAFTPNPMVAPLLDRSVRPQGLTLCASTVHPSELYWRQLRFGEFDVAELSLASLLIATARGNRDWVAVPVFTMRKVFHTEIMARANADVHSPADLVGRRVGVCEYQQTAAVWSRGVLQHCYGVHPRDLHWVMERGSERSHGAATGFKSPPGVTIEYAPSGTSLQDLMADGTLDAVVTHAKASNLVDGTRMPAHPGLMRPLFPDPWAESNRYRAETGLLPVNRVVVVRRSLAEKHPWIPGNLFHAFVAAKAVAVQRARDLTAPWVWTGRLAPAAHDALADDPLPYGLAGQRTVLDTLTRYLHEQGLTDRIVAVDEVFAASTLTL
jgi:4,5-dihydroxyphthalate decarboxylase